MFVLLLVLWIVFNGRFTWEIAAFGAALSAAITLFAAKFLGYSTKRALDVLKRLWKARAYPFVLLKEIVKSNIELAKRVWRPHIEVKPKLVRFRTPLKAPVSRELLANSITLTPGTITVALEGDEMAVHCLDDGFSEDIENCVFQKLLAQTEEGEKRDEH